MGRAPCCDKDGLKKGPWMPEEDQKLIDYIQKHGYGNWRTLPKNAGLQRCGKSCRLRWTNYLRPDIKRGKFSDEEEEAIIQLHGILGNKWSAIAASLPGRTDNEIKNFWNTHIRKRLLRMGIDPVTHAPRLDLLDLSSVFNPSLCNPPHYLMNHISSSLLQVDPSTYPELLTLAASSAPTQIENQKYHHALESQISNCQLQESHHPNFTLENQGVNSNIPFPVEPNLGEHNSWQLQPNLNDSLQVSNHNYIYVSEQPSFNSSSENLDNLCNGYQNFSYSASVYSTPSSSPTTLISNSSYIIGSTENEREFSYCSSEYDMMKYELIPERLGVDGELNML